MRPLDEILDELQSLDDCVFRPAMRLPELAPGFRLPDDLAAFYARFSEARLFGHPSDPRYHILPPEEFVQIGHAIYGQQASEPVPNSWYALAHVQDGNYIAIDCHPSRLGYCYDAFHETTHILSYCKVIALSFTELMNNAAAAGDRAWWLKDGFDGYGYADKLARPIG
jgi:antitoxin YokJ